MKRDKEIIGLFIFCCVFQAIYFKYFMNRENPFAYFQGVYAADSTVFPYLEMCVLCSPVIMLILLFSDSYSFHMENYGRLLLVRNCNMEKRIGNIYDYLALKLLIMVGMQMFINIIFHPFYFIDNIEKLMKGEIAYYLILLFLIILEFCICSWMEENLVQIFLNLYLFISCIICYYLKNTVVQILFMPGKIMVLERFFENEKWSAYLKNEIMLPVMGGIVLYIITVMHCKRKDIF